jgi:hypothetical protein
VTRPQHAGDILHQKNRRLERPDELKIGMNEIVAVIGYTRIVDPMRGEALAGRASQQKIARLSYRKISSKMTSGDIFEMSPSNTEGPSSPQHKFLR